MENNNHAAFEMMPATVGDYVEIKPAFTMDDPAHFDEVTAFAGWIVEVSGSDALIETATGDVWVSRRRVKRL